MEFFKTTWLLRFFVCFIIGVVSCLTIVFIFYYQQNLDTFCLSNTLERTFSFLQRFEKLRWYLFFPGFYVIGEMFCSVGDAILSLYMEFFPRKLLSPADLEKHFEHVLPDKGISYSQVIAIFSERERDVAISYHNSELHFVLSYTAAGMASLFIFLAALFEFSLSKTLFFFMIIFFLMFFMVFIYKDHLKRFFQETFNEYPVVKAVVIPALIIFSGFLLLTGKLVIILLLTFSLFSWQRAYFHRCFANLINYGRWRELKN